MRLPCARRMRRIMLAWKNRREHDQRDASLRKHALRGVRNRLLGNTDSHMDCIEIVRDQTLATNTPIVVVRYDQTQVTHEAAIGTVNHKELETLLVRGLTEEEAVDLIIRGIVR